MHTHTLYVSPIDIYIYSQYFSCDQVALWFSTVRQAGFCSSQLQSRCQNALSYTPPFVSEDTYAFRAHPFQLIDRDCFYQSAFKILRQLSIAPLYRRIYLKAVTCIINCAFYWTYIRRLYRLNANLIRAFVKAQNKRFQVLNINISIHLSIITF